MKFKTALKILAIALCFQMVEVNAVVNPPPLYCAYFGSGNDPDGNNSKDRRGYPDTCINTETDPFGANCGGACMVVADKNLPEAKYCVICPSGSETPCACNPNGTAVNKDVIKGTCKWGTNDPSLPKECYCEYTGAPVSNAFTPCN
jgi:hypothetical protein